MQPYARIWEDDRKSTGGSPENDRTHPPKAQALIEWLPLLDTMLRRTGLIAKRWGWLGARRDEKTEGESMTPNADVPSVLFGCFRGFAVQMADDRLRRAWFGKIGAG